MVTNTHRDAVRWLRPLWECIGINFIAKIQVPSLPRATLTQNWHTVYTHPRTLLHSSPSLSPTITSFTNTHSHPFSIHSSALCLPLCCSLFAFHWLKHSSRCRTTKFTSSIKHEISSSSLPLCVCQSPWECRPWVGGWVGVSASWLSLIQDREGRLICIADSCATIGYILPHPEPRNKQTNNRSWTKCK